MLFFTVLNKPRGRGRQRAWTAFRFENASQSSAEEAMWLMGYNSHDYFLLGEQDVKVENVPVSETETAPFYTYQGQQTRELHVDFRDVEIVESDHPIIIKVL